MNPQSPSSRATALLREPWFMVPFTVLVLIVLFTILAPWVAPHSPLQQSSDILVGPSRKHWLGTDDLGRDVLSRVLHGGRQPLVSAALAVAFSSVLGTAIGLFAGYAPRLPSAIVMRLMDILLGFPAMLLALLVLATLGSGKIAQAIAIALAFLPIYGRLVYSSSLSIRSEVFVDAARVSGVAGWKIAARYIFPQLRPAVIVLMTSSLGWALLLSSTLSFLGMGVHPPAPDWGSDLSEAQSFLSTAWWMSVGPGVALTITVLSASLLGDFLGQGRNGLSRRTARQKHGAAL